jgi:hypothetical protein
MFCETKHDLLSLEKTGLDRLGVRGLGVRKLCLTDGEPLL